MGQAVGWVGIKGMGHWDILNVLNLVESPGDPKAHASICAMPNGWTIVLTSDFGYPTPERMAAVSANGRAIALSAEEHVMFSVVRGYEDGKAIFAIEHDGGQFGNRHISAAGTLPPEWPAILKRLSAEQDEEDSGAAEVDCLFDAPLDLAQALCGYRHDEVWPDGQEPIETFLADRKKPGLLSRLFGR